MSSASFNRVFLMGNLTRDPEIRRLPTGTAVATLRLAINESFNKRDGSREERTLFMDVDVWERQAENCQSFLTKGSAVFVEGRLQMDTWEDKNTGEKKSRIRVRADRVQFLDRRREDGPQGGSDRSSSYSAPRPQSQPHTYNDPLSSDADEEIPF